VILDQFDPQKPFYSLVLAYICQVHGLSELVSRGYHRAFEEFMRKMGPPPYMSRKQQVAIFLATTDEAIRDEAEQTLMGGTTTLMLPMEMQARSGEGVKWDVGELADTVLKDEYNATLRFFNRLTAGSLLVMAWEHVKPKYRRDPVAQFLRHCRNAAAHNGVFTFEHGQPDKPAEWRGIKIVRTLEGSPLFTDPPRKGFMGPGDAVHLLADIEKKFM
jgi:hypothetical protein